jgi:hypothetical protein
MIRSFPIEEAKIRAAASSSTKQCECQASALAPGLLQWHQSIALANKG